MSHFRIFLAVSLGVVFCAHYFLYFSFVRFFRITDTRFRIILGLVFAFLSVSFIFASYLSHMRDTGFTRAFYLFSSSWLGLFLYLLMAAVAAWLVMGIGSLAGHRPSMPVAAGILLGIAFAVAAYGAWNASGPQLREVRVHINGLPDAWKGRTIAQLSDVHLGHIYRADFLERIVKRVGALHPDMVVITGDLFDGMDGDLYGIVEPLKGLKAPYGVYFVTGNHETYLGVDRVYSIMSTTGVTALKDEVHMLDGLQLAGISYPQRGTTKVAGDVMKKLPGFVPGMPTVLLYHSPVHVAEAKAAGVGLQLSGHTHKGQLFPFNYITSRIYKGLDYGLHRFGDYSIYTSPGVGTWGPPMRIGNTPEIVRVTLE